VTWGELRNARAQIFQYAFARLKVDLGGQDCALAPGDLLLDFHGDGAYAVLRFEGTTAERPPENAKLRVRYDLLFDLDAQHRGLFNLAFRPETKILASENGYDTAKNLVKSMLAGADASAVFSPDHDEQSFSRELPGWKGQIAQFFHNGVWHIWSGYDHIA